MYRKTNPKWAICPHKVALFFDTDLVYYSKKLLMNWIVHIISLILVSYL